MAKQIILGLIAPVLIGLFVAFVPNGVIWFLFSVGVLIIAMCLYSMGLRMAGKPSPIYRGTPPPWWADATFGLVGAIVVVSAAPGLFFAQPNWAIDHIYRAISVLIG